MRQYRGLTKDGKWVYGWLVKDVAGKCYIVKDGFCLEKQLPGYASYGIFDYTRVIPETVGQSVIVEGKKYYEGDVTKDDSGNIGVVRFGKLPLGKPGDCVCTYPSFYIHCLGQLGQAPTYECEEIGEWMEIIGTIHTTHPELLEK